MCGDQRTVRERDTQLGSLCAADGLPVLAGRLVSDLTIWTDVVGRENEPMTNCPGLMDLTALPTSSTMPQYSCPIAVG